MKMLTFILFTCFCLTSNAQLIDSLNTARNCSYMTSEEREMIYELNRLRSDPSSYLQYIQPLLDEAVRVLKENGKGPGNYSLTYTTSFSNGRKTVTIDTTWHFVYEENVKALNSLVADMKKLKRLSILRPDSGIYIAAKKHRADQDKHGWGLMHTGSDGSMPWDRIVRFSPRMLTGNENIAGQSGIPTVREIVLQLLIDAGIPGYGHRYNMLDPQWTHAACTATNYKGTMYWWIQEFGKIKTE